MSDAKGPLPQCAPMCKIQGILGGKWKIIILWYIEQYGARRFSELKKQIPAITQSTLTKQLRELEQDRFISRHIYPEIPPKVEYRLTDLGNSFAPLLKEMKSWSELHL